MGKGSDRERQAVDLLKRAYFAPYRPATVRFGENDLWGMFDVLAVSPCYNRVKAIQVKSNRAVGIRAYCTHTWLWRRLGFDTEYWVPIDNEGWRIIDANDEGHETVYDEREDEDVGPHRDTPLTLGDGVVRWLKGQQNGIE